MGDRLGEQRMSPSRATGERSKMRSGHQERRTRRPGERRWAYLITIPLITLAISAAGGNPSSDREPRASCPVDALPESGKPIKVVVWAAYVGETKRELMRLAERYNASQGRVVVRVVSDAPDYEELRARYKDAARSETLPALAIMEHTNTRSLADSGTIVPGEACFQADHISLRQFSPTARKSFSVDGVLQPVSVNLAAPMMYFNRQHFVRAGLNPDNPPRTLEELRAAAEAIRAAGVTQKPLVMQITPWYIEEWIIGAGETIVDQHDGRSSHRPGSATLDSPATEYVLTWLRSMVADGLLNPVDSTGTGFEHFLEMALGRSSITIHSSTGIATIDAALAGTLDPRDIGLEIQVPALALGTALDIGVTSFPGIETQGSPVIGGSAWYLTNTTPVEVQAAAWDFIKFVNSPSAQAEWNLEGSVISWRKEPAADAAVQETTQSRIARWLAIAHDSLTDAGPAPLVGPYAQLRAEISKLVDAAVINGTNVQDAIAAANRRITTALKHYNEASRH